MVNKMKVLYFFEWLMQVTKRERRDIAGCEYDGTHDSILLSRYTIFGRRDHPSLYLHIFRRSDHDRELHDHPWSFTTLLLWPGYIEETQSGKRRKFPLQLLFRPALFRHRVELLPVYEYSISLVFVGPKKRVWGFWRDGDFIPFKKYFEEKGF